MSQYKLILKSAPETIPNPVYRGAGNTQDMEDLANQGQVNDKDIWANTDTNTEWEYLAVNTAWGDTTQPFGTTPTDIVNSGTISVDPYTGIGKVNQEEVIQGGSPLQIVSIKKSDYVNGLNDGSLADAFYKVVGKFPTGKIVRSSQIQQYTTRGPVLATDAYIYVSGETGPVSYLSRIDRTTGAYSTLPIPNGATVGSVGGSTIWGGIELANNIVIRAESNLIVINKHTDAVTLIPVPSQFSNTHFYGMSVYGGGRRKEAVRPLIRSDNKAAWFTSFSGGYTQWLGCITEAPDESCSVTTSSLTTRYKLPCLAIVGKDDQLYIPAGTANNSATEIDVYDTACNQVKTYSSAVVLATACGSKVGMLDNGCIVFYGSTALTGSARTVLVIDSHPGSTAPSLTAQVVSAGSATNLNAQYSGDMIIDGFNAYVIEAMGNDVNLCVTSATSNGATITIATNRIPIGACYSGMGNNPSYGSVTFKDSFGKTHVLYPEGNTAAAEMTLVRVDVDKDPVSGFLVNATPVIVSDSFVDGGISKYMQISGQACRIEEFNRKLYICGYGSGTIASVDLDTSAQDMFATEYSVGTQWTAPQVIDENTLIFMPYYGYSKPDDLWYDLGIAQGAYMAGASYPLSASLSQRYPISGKIVTSTQITKTGAIVYVESGQSAEGHLVVDGEQII